VHQPRSHADRLLHGSPIQAPIVLDPMARPPRRRWFAALLLPLVLLPAGARSADVPPSERPVTYQATVLKVENGQVLRVRIGTEERRVRLACVQAPRSSQDPWAWQASQALQRLLPLGGPVEIGLRARDVFGRLVGVVRHNGRDVAPSLLRQGALFAFDGYLGQCADLHYARSEAQAREARRGVWSVKGGIERPWDLSARQGDSGEEP